MYGALDVRLFLNKRLNVDLKNIEIWVSHGLNISALPGFCPLQPQCKLFIDNLFVSKSILKLLFSLQQNYFGVVSLRGILRR